MARTTLSVQNIVRASLTPSYTAAETDGHAFDNTGERVFLHVKNASGVSVDLTVVTPNSVDGCAIADKIVSIPAGDNYMVGPFPKGLYEQVDTTLSLARAIWFQCSPTTSVTYAALRLPSA